MTVQVNQSAQCGNWVVREDLKYDRNNFWIRVEGRQAFIGLSDYGQWVIGDILYLELVPAGSPIIRGERFGSVESGKWVGNLIAPVSGTILEYNQDAVADPRLIQEDPYGTGWIMKVDVEFESDLDSLLDHSDYADFIKEQADKAA